MYAVIVSGGAQHRVSEGEVVRVQKINGAATGSTIEVGPVLLVHDGKDLQVGTPALGGAKVLATVVEEGLGEKIRVFKSKKRKQYRRTRGHRQAYTALRIDRIVV